MHMNQKLGEEKSVFLKRITKSLGYEKASVPKNVPGVDEAVFRLLEEDADLLARFKQGAEVVGMLVTVCEQDEVKDVFRRLCEKYQAKKVIRGWGKKLDDLGLETVIDDAGAVLYVPADGVCNFEGQYDAEIGVTDVTAALAETGTLVIESGKDGGGGGGRGASLVPECHVAIVRECDLVADMIDYWARFKGIEGNDQPSSKVFITGPSKTADIEGVLITGVHGPREVEIVVVKGM
ncbi:Lactate utilization protein C [Poriferisphaera corsica]|uniref:Lactate utilization protein C n=1 Tax=Poriferisphaera corsica TaxID=2528020 RepID=A0A517YQH7_9BACT|nr:LUD domain-containing protein [Poriferisphaera corsica]QDU32483.1 Lactate utilization protein C [Poriferisphaera corsica]